MADIVFSKVPLDAWEEKVEYFGGEYDTLRRRPAYEEVSVYSENGGYLDTLYVYGGLSRTSIRHAYEKKYGYHTDLYFSKHHSPGKWELAREIE